jgi:hypothetical protein
LTAELDSFLFTTFHAQGGDMTAVLSVVLVLAMQAAATTDWKTTVPLGGFITGRIVTVAMNYKKSS